MDTWVNWVRLSTPSGWWKRRPLTVTSVGLSRTIASTEKPSFSRVTASASSHTARAAAELERAARPMPLDWIPWPGKA